MSYNNNFHSFHKDQGNPSKDRERRNVQYQHNNKNQQKSNHLPFNHARENQTISSYQPPSQIQRSYNSPMNQNQQYTPNYTQTQYNDKSPRVARGHNSNQNRNYPYQQQSNYYQPQYIQKEFQSRDPIPYDPYVPQYPTTLFTSSIAAVSTQLNEHQRDKMYPPFHSPIPVPYTLSSKSVHPFEYFLSQSAERKLDLFLTCRKKIAIHDCKEKCSLGVCDACCNVLKMPCQKHKHVVSDVLLDNSQLAGPVLSAIADWFVTADIDLSITKRASRPIPTTTQNGAIEVDFTYSLLVTPNSENLRVYFFHLETPIVSLFWEADYEYNKKTYHPPAGVSPAKSIRLLCVVYAVTDTSITTQYERLLSSQKMNLDPLFVPNSPTEVTFFCPGTSKKLELPGRSTKCQHAQCIDMKNYFEHNRLNCKEFSCNWCFWICFVCKQRINIVDFKVDNVMVSIMQTVAHDANARSALIHANNGCSLLYANDEAYLKPRLVHRDTKSQISQYFSNDDVEIGQLKLSLKCTILLSRISVPCRSLKCNHLQCFDFSGYLNKKYYRVKKNRYVQYNKVMKKIADPKEWICPLCNGSADIGDVYVDMFVKSILEQAPTSKRKKGGKITNVEVDSVELFQDGTWKVTAETTKKSSNVVDLTLDDEDIEISFISESMLSNYLSPVKDVISKLYSLNSITELSAFYKSVKAKQYFLQIGAQIEKVLKSNKFANPNNAETKLWNSIKSGVSGDMNLQLYRFWTSTTSNANNTNLPVVKRLKEMFPSIPEHFLIPIYDKNNNDFTKSVEDIMSFSEVAMVVNEPPKAVVPPPVIEAPIDMPSDAFEVLRKQLEVATKQNELLNQEVQKYKERLYCCVCYENEINVILFPCNHQCMCSVCAPKVNECPLCKTSIEWRGPVYTPR